MNTQNKQKVQVILPGEHSSIGEFADAVINCMTQTGCFFRYGSKIVLLAESDCCNSDSTFELHSVTHKGFIVDIDEFMECGHIVKDNFKRKRLSVNDINMIFESKKIKGKLPVINGISTIQLPFIYNNKLQFTNPGYCDMIGYWTQSNIKLNRMPVDDAQKIIFDLFSEFTFLERSVDMSVAIAYLLTPALKLFLNGNRAPIFLATANREGVGKDYLLQITPIVYTGNQPNCLPPCVSDDEWRKRILSVCMKGDNFFIVSNVKKHLNSSSLEAAATSPIYTDRVLGKSIAESVPNNAVYCISGNGFSFTKDINRRSLRIHMEYNKEDIQKREFSRDLHKYVEDNRSLIISAIYSCVTHWVEAGMPDGQGRMASFDPWARIITGIMEQCHLGNPFQERTKTSEFFEGSGEQEIPHIKELVQYWAEEIGMKEVYAAPIRELTISHGLFPWLKLEEHSELSFFSKIIRNYSKREFGEYVIRTRKTKKLLKFRLEKIANEESEISELVVQDNPHNETCIPEEELPIDTEALIATNPEAPADLADISEEELELMAEEDYEEDSAS